MTWFQLWKRMGKQPLRLTLHKDVTIKLQDGEHKCKLVYTDNGSNFHLEIDGIEEDYEEEEDYDPWNDYDWCYECAGYGDDYSCDDNGELVSNCDDCPHNPNHCDPWDD